MSEIKFVPIHLNPKLLIATAGADDELYSLCSLSTTPSMTWFLKYCSDEYDSKLRILPISCPCSTAYSMVLINDRTSPSPWLRPCPASGWTECAASLCKSAIETGAVGA